MRHDYKLFTGYRDILSQEAVSTHTTLNEPWVVRITPLSTTEPFSIPPAWLSEGFDWIEAIDWGVGELDRNPDIRQSAIPGEIITIYFQERVNTLAHDKDVLNGELSHLLMQTLVLHDPLPPGVGIYGGPNIVLPYDFTAPNGILNGAGKIVSRWFGAKVGPRIYGEWLMERTTVWPPKVYYWPSDGLGWKPFPDSEVTKEIAYQGDLTDKCRAIYASQLVYTDEDGYERVDAYPSGAKPRMIKNAIRPLVNFQMDSGSQFPIWDTTDLEYCVNPVEAEKVSLPTKSGGISFPIGPDVRNSQNLKIYENGIKSVGRGRTALGLQQEVGIVFGLKLLGVDLPDSVERAVNSHMLYRHQKVREDGNHVGLSATINEVKTGFNFSLGAALETYYGNDQEKLLMPHAPRELRYLNHYGSVSPDSDYTDQGTSRPYYWATFLPNGGLTGLEIPGIDCPNLVVLDGWLEGTFSYGRTGLLDHAVPGGPMHSGTVRHKVPAPPHHDGIIIRNHRKYMASYVSGGEFTYNTIGRPKVMHLAYGRFGAIDEELRPVVALNLKNTWLEGSHPAAIDFRNSIDPDCWQVLTEVASGDIPGPSDYTVTVSYDGFDIEPFDTEGIRYAFSWEEGVFHGAQINPTSIDNILTPIDLSKVQNGIDGAYRYALNIASPLRQSVRIIDQRDNGEPQKLHPIYGNYTPNYTLILGYGVPTSVSDVYTYKLEDIDIPDFLLTDSPGYAYDTWRKIFSNLIYGDIPGFKAAHGIPESTDVGGSLVRPPIETANYLGVGVINWLETPTANRLGKSITIPVPINPSGFASRGFSVNLFREDIPWYPDQEPLNGDPIFIDFSKVPAGYAWTDGDIDSFRELVSFETQPV